MSNTSGKSTHAGTRSENPPSSAYTKSRTTSTNAVALARTGNEKSKSKQSSKRAQVVEVSDSEDDDSLERDAALASPAKGVESRKTTKVSSVLYI